MALHPNFPESPYAELDPEVRWFPAAEELRSTAYEKLLPPLVAAIRREVKAWRDDGYSGATPTSRALLRWWFDTEHLTEAADGTLSPFRYYFAQREAVETVLWLHDARRVRDKFDLLRFDGSGAVSAGMFDETWPRYVLKLATGAGKTKVLSLLIAWSYFHKLYEPGSTLARNILLIAPNIIVLDRLRHDFDGLRIFFSDPILPNNGYDGRNWRDDFQMTLHVQDDVRVQKEVGNLFLTNVHRVFLGDARAPSLDDDDLRDYFLAPFGPKPVGATNDSRTDLGEIIREIDEPAVFNDEAHHIHDPRMAWFKSIQHIHHRMLQKDRGFAVQVDVTATPRHDNGAIFVQNRVGLPSGRRYPPERRQASHPARCGKPGAADRDRIPRVPAGPWPDIEKLLWFISIADNFDNFVTPKAVASPRGKLNGSNSDTIGLPSCEAPMSTLVIKNLPDDLHARLKAQAERNRRSVTMEVVTLIERGTASKRVAPILSPPIKLKSGPITDKDIEAWTNDGRP